MTTDPNKEFLQKYMLDSYSRAIPTRALSGKQATLGEYCEPIDSKAKKTHDDSDDYNSDPDNRYAQPQDAIDVKKVKPRESTAVSKDDDKDVYELAKHHLAEQSTQPQRKPSPKPRSTRQKHPQTQHSPSSPEDQEGRSNNARSTDLDTSPQESHLTYNLASSDIADDHQTPSKREGKKVVEIEYEVASAIRPSVPSRAASFQDHSDSKTSISVKITKVPSAASAFSQPSKLKNFQDSRSKSSDSSSVPGPQLNPTVFAHSMSQAPGGEEVVYEEPWDLKVKRLKQEQEKKGEKMGKKLEHPPGLIKTPSVYEDAWDSSSQQRKLEERLSCVRSLSQNSETEVFHDALDSVPVQKVEGHLSDRGSSGSVKSGSLKALPQNTYEDAWDLKNSLLEQKIREMQIQASATYEEPWDRRKLQAKLQPQRSDSGHPDEVDASQLQRAKSDAVDMAWKGEQKNSVQGGKYHSVDESKFKSRGRGANFGQRINPTIPLTSQNWYHGNISRDDAEKMLCVCKEGSFIVRISSDRKSYSLSIKSAKQYIHVQIEQVGLPDGSIHYILGKNSKEFATIPEMVDYYTHHRVPLKGAEHITLQHPVECKWSQLQE